MLRSGAILVGAFALIGLSAASGFDRMARTDRAVAAAMPRIAARAALETLGSEALAAGRGEDLAAYGWHAVDRTPFEAHSIALFAAGQLATGHAATAERGFALAGRMGWRVPLVQAYWLDRALAAKDYDGAAMRLDALLRQVPTLVGQQALLDRVERDPAARAALVERLDPGTAWLDKYLGEVFALPPPVLRQRAQMMIDAAGSGLVLGCGSVADLAAAMTNAGLFAEAGRLWAAQCADAHGPLLGGDGFATLELQGSRSPFAWHAAGNGDAAMTLGPAARGNGYRLTIEAAFPTLRPFLSKLLLLPQGRYRLQWREGESPAPIRAAFGCQGRAETFLPIASAGDARSATLEVPAGCTAQILRFMLSPGKTSTWLEAVEISPQA